MQRSQEYVRLRHLLFAVMGIAAALSLVRLVIPTGSFKDSSEPIAAGPFASVTAKRRTYRPPIVAKAFFEPKLARSTITRSSIVDMNDHGDYLFLVSPPDATYREYAHYYNGKQESLGRVTTDIRYFLSPKGNIVRRVAQAQMASSMQARMFGGPVTMAYNEIRFFRRFNDDGSVLNVRFEQQKDKSLYRLRLDKANTAPTFLYSSLNPLAILEKGESGEVWLREMAKEKAGSHDILWKMKDGKKEAVFFPKGYTQVDRVVQTGETVAATFGEFLGPEPLRTYIRIGRQWKELPLPPGYTFSYVQRVMRDGLILGFVTDGDRDHFHQVVWKGDAVAILDELAAWPKNGQLSYVVQATRNGDIYVRNVTDTASGASEYYLLTLKS